MKEYSLVFIFDSTLEKVLLVRKKGPEWQKGKLNGVGGKLEVGEDGLSCVAREVFEETGVQLDFDQYVYFGAMGNSEWKAYLYAVLLTTEYDFSQGVEDIIWCEVKNLPGEIISNLSWLVPLALDKLRASEVEIVNIKYI